MQLQRHPMIIHAYFARALLLKAYDFLQDFSGPLYEWASTTRWMLFQTSDHDNIG